MAARFLRCRTQPHAAPPPARKDTMRKRSATPVTFACLALLLTACTQGIVEDSPVADLRADLVLAGTATASSVEATGLEAPKAVDGNMTTRWSSAFSDPQWI